MTVEFGSAVPEIVGVELLAAEEVDKEVGAAGTVASIVIDRAEEAEEVLPAASVAVAVNE